MRISFVIVLSTCESRVDKTQLLLKKRETFFYWLTKGCLDSLILKEVMERRGDY